MSKVCIDVDGLKQYIATDFSIINIEDKGFLIDVQTVLKDIDFVVDNYALDVPEYSVDIKKWMRRLYRAKQHLKELKANEKNLSEWGKHDLGYFKGYVSAIENLFDDLDIDIEE